MYDTRTQNVAMQEIMLPARVNLATTSSYAMWTVTQGPGCPFRFGAAPGDSQKTQSHMENSPMISMPRTIRSLNQREGMYGGSSKISGVGQVWSRGKLVHLGSRKKNRTLISLPRTPPFPCHSQQVETRSQLVSVTRSDSGCICLSQPIQDIYPQTGSLFGIVQASISCAIIS